MRNVAILFDKYGQSRPEKTDSKESDYEVHLYPFANLEVRLHVDPRLVIYRTGYTLTEKFGPKGDPAFRARYPSVKYPTLIEKLQMIYFAWNRSIPNDPDSKDPTFKYDSTLDLKYADDSSKKTGDGRAPPITGAKRPRLDDSGRESPYPKAGSSFSSQ
jgi:hypothetical protein